MYIQKALLIVMFLSLLLSSCYEKKSGCLDIYSTNFDAGADINCCCEFPKLALNFTNLNGANIYNTIDTISNDLGQNFKITALTYYLSEFSLKDANGNAYSTTDTFHVPVTNSEVIVKNDIAIVRPGTVSITLGSFSQKSDVTNVKFQFGPPIEVNDALIDNILSTRPLSRQADTMYTIAPVKGYASIKIKYTSDITSDSQEKTLYIYDKIPVELSVDFPVIVASNTCISIVNDFKYWFHDVDVKLDAPAVVSSKIISNIKKSTFILQCQ